MSETVSIDQLVAQALDCYGRGDLLGVVSRAEHILKLDSQSATAHFLVGLVHIASDNTESANQFFARGLELRSIDPLLHQIAGVSLEAQGKFALAQMQFESALRLRPSYIDALVHHAQVCLGQELYSEALNSYLQVLAIESNSPTALDGIKKVSTALNEFAESCRYARRLNPAVPPGLAIVVNGTECVAGIFVMSELRDGLGLIQRHRLTNELRDDCTIILDNVRSLLERGGICHSHISPRAENIIALSCLGMRRFLCQVRDPRQTMISALRWFDTEYEMAKSAGDRFRVLLYHTLISEEYFSLPESQKIDVLIETRFVRHLNWIDGWLKASRDPEWNFEILFTKFEDFKTNRSEFYGRILDFYGVPRSAIQLPPHEPTPAAYVPGAPMYFRRGSLDEWRSVVTQQQYDRMMAKIPDEMLNYFGWEE